MAVHPAPRDEREAGGPTLAWLKRPVRASRFVSDENVNENNHPIRAGDILDTHNGTIYNANTLFRRFKLRRFAEVDSELLCRLAARAGGNGQIDIERFKDRLRFCRAGQMAAVLALRLNPETTLVAQGQQAA